MDGYVFSFSLCRCSTHFVSTLYFHFKQPIWRVNKCWFIDIKSMYHLAFYLNTPKASYKKGVSDLCFVFCFFFNSMLWFTYRGRKKKEEGFRGSECGSQSRSRNVSSVFVSICGRWWMTLVDVIIWLITQVLNKNSQPVWVDIVIGRIGESAASLSRRWLGRGDWRIAQETEKGWYWYTHTNTLHLHL